MSGVILKDKITHKLNKNGRYSYSVIIPKEVVKKFGWREKQKLNLEIDLRGKKIIIKDWLPARKAKKK